MFFFTPKSNYSIPFPFPFPPLSGEGNLLRLRGLRDAVALGVLFLQVRGMDQPRVTLKGIAGGSRGFSDDRFLQPAGFPAGIAGNTRTDSKIRPRVGLRTRPRDEQTGLLPEP